MDFFAEDMGRVAKMRVDEKGVAFKGITPKKAGAVEIAVVGKAKVVAVKAASRNELLATLQDSELNMAIKDAWVLVADGEFNEEFASWIHPYVAIVNKGQTADYETYARGWNVDCGTECVHKKCVSLGVDGIAIEVLFGESRESPIGLLSVKCIKE